MLLKVAEVYTQTPGGRYESQGPYSGERFRDEFLIPSYDLSVEKEEKLMVHLDGGYGYGSGFLEESFGGMVRCGYDGKELLKNMQFISEDQPSLVEKIQGYIKDAVKVQKQNQKRKR